MTTRSNTPRKILHIAPTPFHSDRGCHIRIEGIVRSLSNLGHSNTVCTYHHGNEYQGVTTRRIGNIKHYTKTSAGPSAWKMWADLKLLILVIKQIKAEKPDVLHAHLHEGVLVGLLSKWLLLKKIPLIADMQGSLVGELDSYGFFKRISFLKLPFRWLEYFLLSNSSHVVCSSEHSLKKFRTTFPKLAEKIDLAQDGADRVPHAPDQEKQKIKEQLRIPNERILAVYSGALLESKGVNELHQLLLKSLTNKGQNSPEAVHFLIIGYPTQNTEAFIKKHSLSPHCSLTGRVEFKELNKYLGIADIAIDTKNSDSGEGSGKMLNYLANALPVLAFDTLNNRQFLGPDALLAKDIEVMLQQLKEFSTNPELRKQHSIRNQQLFETTCSWQLTQKQLESVYTQLF